MFKLVENVFFEKIDTESYFIDVNTGRYIYNNVSATVIIEHLLNSSNIDEVIEKVQKDLQVDTDLLQKDITELLNQLRKLNLIYWCGDN